MSSVLGAAPPTDTPPAPAPIVTVQNLVKRYGDFVAVDRVSFSVRKGEIFGIIGPN
jgi:ABC-2 type transport system ATP-binding protein